MNSDEVTVRHNPDATYPISIYTVNNVALTYAEAVQVMEKLGDILFSVGHIRDRN